MSGGGQAYPEWPMFSYVLVLARALTLSFRLSPALLITCLFTSLLHWGYVVPVLPLPEIKPWALSPRAMHESLSLTH